MSFNEISADCTMTPNIIMSSEFLHAITKAYSDLIWIVLPPAFQGALCFFKSMISQLILFFDLVVLIKTGLTAIFIIVAHCNR